MKGRIAIVLLMVFFGGLVLGRWLPAHDSTPRDTTPVSLPQALPAANTADAGPLLPEELARRGLLGLLGLLDPADERVKRVRAELFELPA